MPETLAYTYTTDTEIRRTIRSADVTLLLDDDGDGTAETDALTDIIDEATDYINQYCLPWYAASALNNSLWVRRRCTKVAIYFLSQRRAQSAKMSSEFERITQELEKVFKGQLQIPRLAFRANLAPAVSNYTIDDYHATQKLRVQRSTSTGGTYSGGHYDDTSGGGSGGGGVNDVEWG